MTSLPPSVLICIPFSFLFVFLFFLCLVALPPKPQDSAECKRFAWTSLLCSQSSRKSLLLFIPESDGSGCRVGASFSILIHREIFTEQASNPSRWRPRLRYSPFTWLMTLVDICMLNQSCSWNQPVFQSINQRGRDFFFFFFLRALRGSLFSAYHSVLQKNKKKAAQLFPQLVALTCPWDQGMQQKKPIPRVYTRHSDVNHEN